MYSDKLSNEFWLKKSCMYIFLLLLRSYTLVSRETVYWFTESHVSILFICRIKLKKMFFSFLHLPSHSTFSHTTLRLHLQFTFTGLPCQFPFCIYSYSFTFFFFRRSFSMDALSLRLLTV